MLFDSFLIYSLRYANSCIGGELRLFCKDGVVDVKPEQDRLVLFQAREIEHAVLACQTDRYAVSMWLCE